MKVKLLGTTKESSIVADKWYKVVGYKDNIDYESLWIEDDYGNNHYIRINGKQNVCAYAATGYWELYL